MKAILHNRTTIPTIIHFIAYIGDIIPYPLSLINFAQERP